MQIDESKKIIKSPLNYTGGKYKLLPQILPYFPDKNKVDNFIDMFAGGGNVFINSNYENIVVNDKLKVVLELHKYFYENSLEDILKNVKDTIKKYSLSIDNEKGYLEMRNDYNKSKERNPILFYLLIIHSFNNYIKFNGKGNFSVGFGKGRSFYSKTSEEKLIDYVTELHKKSINFFSEDFRYFKDINGTNFYYADPPYLITNAPYNSSWTSMHEIRLLNHLDMLHKNNQLFMLSNVIEHKGLNNGMLINWSKKYNLVELNFNYDYSNYSKNINREDNKTTEIIVKNF